MRGHRSNGGVDVQDGSAIGAMLSGSRMKTIGALALITILLCVPSYSSPQAHDLQKGHDITIRVLNGKTDKPVANQHFVVFLGNTEEDVRLERHPVEGRTGRDGSFVLKDRDSEYRFMQIWVDWYAVCEKSLRTFSIDEIRSGGLTTDNTCGKAHAQTAVGEFIVFVRPKTFWEKMRS